MIFPLACLYFLHFFDDAWFSSFVCFSLFFCDVGRFVNVSFLKDFKKIRFMLCLCYGSILSLLKWLLLIDAKTLNGFSVNFFIASRFSRFWIIEISESFSDWWIIAWRLFATSLFCLLLEMVFWKLKCLEYSLSLVLLLFLKWFRHLS